MSITTLLNQVRKRTNSTSLKTSKSAKIDHWISTGFPALNRICSGSIYRGVPSGRVIVLGGESASGKSLVMAKIIGNAVNEHSYDIIFFLDSEMGTTSY
jgi:RecA/RadA recombinase